MMSQETVSAIQHNKIANHIDDIVRKYKCWAQHATYERGKTSFSVVKRGCYELNCIQITITDTTITAFERSSWMVRFFTYYLADPDCFQQFETAIVPLLNNMPVEPNY